MGSLAEEISKERCDRAQPCSTCKWVKTLSPSDLALYREWMDQRKPVLPLHRALRRMDSSPAIPVGYSRFRIHVMECEYGQP